MIGCLGRRRAKLLTRSLWADLNSSLSSSLPMMKLSTCSTRIDTSFASSSATARHDPSDGALSHLSGNVDFGLPAPVLLPCNDDLRCLGDVGEIPVPFRPCESLKDRTVDTVGVLNRNTFPPPAPNPPKSPSSMRPNTHTERGPEQNRGGQKLLQVVRLLALKRGRVVPMASLFALLALLMSSMASSAGSLGGLYAGGAEAVPGNPVSGRNCLGRLVRLRGGALDTEMLLKSDPVLRREIEIDCERAEQGRLPAFVENLFMGKETDEYE